MAGRDGGGVIFLSGGGVQTLGLAAGGARQDVSSLKGRTAFYVVIPVPPRFTSFQHAKRLTRHPVRSAAFFTVRCRHGILKQRTHFEPRFRVCDAPQRCASCRRRVIDATARNDGCRESAISRLGIIPEPVTIVAGMTVGGGSASRPIPS